MNSLVSEAMKVNADEQAWIDYFTSELVKTEKGKADLKAWTDYFASEGDVLLIPNRIFHNQVKSIGANAFNRLFLKSVTIPNSVTKIGIDAFQSNELTSIMLPNSLIELNGFRDNNIIEIEIPISVKIIGAHAFSHNKVNNLVIPNNIIEIGAYAFANNDITTLTIPNSVTKIGFSAFNNNPLKQIIIGSNVIIDKINGEILHQSEVKPRVDRPTRLKERYKLYSEKVKFHEYEAFIQYYTSNKERSGIYEYKNDKWTYSFWKNFVYRIKKWFSR